MPRISAIEFGSRGGNGLLALENAAELVEQEMGIEVDVYGFDTGAGLPPPLDYRDLPNLYTATAYPDGRGIIAQSTVETRAAHPGVGRGNRADVSLLSNPAPIGFISVRCGLLHVDSRRLQGSGMRSGRSSCPRIHCYFDDMIGFTFSEYTGERLADRANNQ